MEHSENHRKSLMIPLELLLITRQIGRPCFPSLFPWTGSTYITRKRYCWCTEKQSWVLRVLSFVAMNWITNPLKYEEILTGSCQESKLEKEHPWLHKKNWLYLYLSRLSFSLKYKMIWTFNILFFFTWTLHMRGVIMRKLFSVISTFVEFVNTVNIFDQTKFSLGIRRTGYTTYALEILGVTRSMRGQNKHSSI